MKLVSLENLFLCLLSDVYIIEKQNVKDLPMVIKKCHSEELKDGLHTRLEEAKAQLKRLEKIFKLIDQSPKRTEWEGDIKNLFLDAGAFLKENEPSPLLDAAIIAISQRIEHFEIATYGTLKEFASVLEIDEVKDLLAETLKEEVKGDHALTKLAEGRLFSKGINVAAARQ